MASAATRPRSSSPTRGSSSPATRSRRDLRDLWTIPLAGARRRRRRPPLRPPGAAPLRPLPRARDVRRRRRAAARAAAVRRAPPAAAAGINLFGLPDRLSGSASRRPPRPHADATTTGSTTSAGRSRPSLLVVAWLLLPAAASARALRAVRDSEVAAAAFGRQPRADEDARLRDQRVLRRRGRRRSSRSTRPSSTRTSSADHALDLPRSSASSSAGSARCRRSSSAPASSCSCPATSPRRVLDEAPGVAGDRRSARS